MHTTVLEESVLSLAPTFTADPETTRKFYERLKGWDTLPVKQLGTERGPFSEADIDQQFDEFHKWLALTLAHRNYLIPIPDLLDEVWHFHILFTEDYAAMCQAVDGEFFHHRPRNIANDDDGRPWDLNYDLYATVFGERPLNFWPSLEGKGKGDCGRCDCCTKCKKAP